MVYSLSIQKKGKQKTQKEISGEDAWKHNKFDCVFYPHIQYSNPHTKENLFQTVFVQILINSLLIMPSSAESIKVNQTTESFVVDFQ